MREDTLKNLLSSKGNTAPTTGAQEVKISGSISPVANIKVV